MLPIHTIRMLLISLLLAHLSLAVAGTCETRHPLWRTLSPCNGLQGLTCDDQANNVGFTAVCSCLNGWNCTVSEKPCCYQCGSTTTYGTFYPNYDHDCKFTGVDGGIFHALSVKILSASGFPAQLFSPDPYVQIYRNGALSATTSAKASTYTPSWNESFSLGTRSISGAFLNFKVYDDDAFSDSLFGSQTIDGAFYFENPPSSPVTLFLNGGSPISLTFEIFFGNASSQTPTQPPAPEPTDPPAPTEPPR